MLAAVQRNMAALLPKRRADAERAAKNLSQRDGARLQRPLPKG